MAQAPELTTQLPMGVQGMLGLMLTGCRVDLDQVSSSSRPGCQSAAWVPG